MSYRIFPSTSGPGASTSFSGTIVLGTLFKVTQPGMQLDGYWYWRADSTQQATANFALWKATGAGTGTLVASSAVTTTTMVVGQWNFVALASPVALTSGTAYKAQVGVTNNFLDSKPYFGSGGAGSAGITNGPLFCFSDSAGTAADTYNDNQCTYALSTNDPTSVYGTQTDTGFNCWVDVQVSIAVGRPMVPVPRRYPARGRWTTPRPVAANAAVASVAGSQPGGLIRRRAAARAFWRFAAGLLNAHGGNGTVQPRATVPVPRRTAARAVWAGTVTRTTNAVPSVNPAGSPPGGLVIHRRQARSLWGGSAGQAPGVPVAGTVQPRMVIARRTAARTVWRGPPARPRTRQRRQPAEASPAAWSGAGRQPAGSGPASPPRSPTSPDLPSRRPRSRSRGAPRPGRSGAPSSAPSTPAGRREPSSQGQPSPCLAGPQCASCGAPRPARRTPTARQGASSRT